MARGCPGCGHEVATATARWCGRCGARLTRLGTSDSTLATAARPFNGHVVDRDRFPSTLEPGPHAAASGTRDATVAAGLSGPVDTLVRGEAIDLSNLDLDASPDDVEADPVPDDAPRTRRTRVLAVLVALATVAGVLAMQPEPEIVYPPAGYAAGGEPTRSGRVSHAPLEALPTDLAWSVQLAVPLTRTSIVVGDQVALEVGGNGAVGRDPEDGTVRWIRQDLQLAGEPVVGDTIVATESRGEIVGLDPATGRTLWRRDDLRGFVRPLHGSGFVLLDRGDGLSVIDPQDGAVQWDRDLRVQTDVPDVEVWGSAPAGDLIVVSGTSPAGLVPSHPNSRHLAIGLESRSGEVRWVQELPGQLDQGRRVTASRDGTSAWTDEVRGVTIIDRTGQVTQEGLGGVVPGRDADAPAETTDVGESPSAADSIPDARSLGAIPPPVIHSTAITCCAGELSGRAPVVVAVRPTTATAFDTATGAELWEWSPLEGEGSVDVMTWFDDTFLGRSWDPEEHTATSIDPVTGQVRVVHRQPAEDGDFTWFDLRGYRIRVRGASYAIGTVDEPERWDSAHALSPGGGPAVRDDVVVVPTTTGTLAVELADGSVRWKVAVKSSDQGGLGYRWATPAIGETTVAASPALGVFQNLKPTDRLAGYDVATGVTSWSRGNDATPPRGEVTLDGDRAFLAVGREVHGYDLLTGRRAFAAKSVDGVEWLAVTPTHVVGTPDRTGRPPVEVNRLEAVGILRADRSVAWRVPATDACTPPVIARDVILSETHPLSSSTDPGERPTDLAIWGEMTRVRAVDVATGIELWELPGAGPVCTPLAVADGRAFLLPSFAELTIGGAPRSPLGTELLAVDVASGTFDWQATLPSPATTAPVIAGDHLLIGLADGRIVAVAPDTGEIAFETSVDGIPAAPPVLAEDGTLLVLLTDGRLVALR